MKKTRPVKHPPEVVQKIETMRKSGVQPKDIARQLNVSRASVSKFSAKGPGVVVGRPRVGEAVANGFYDDGGLCPITGFKGF